MPALAELEQVIASQEAAPATPEVAEPEVAAAPTADTTGAVPEVAENGAMVEPGETASEQAFGDKPTAQSGEVDGGMYSPDEYQAACTAAGTPDKWDDRYAAGHTEATQWTQPYDGGHDMTFKLQRGQSAAQALKDFIAGPTIADWKTIAVAIELNEVRDGMGDAKFDQLFGSRVVGDDAQIPPAQRLQISVAMYTVPFASQMEALAEQKDEALDASEEEPEAPAVAAQVEEKPVEGGVTQQPAPELVAEELGVEREQQFA
ncbi:MAG TPA: hypothetical protein VHW23_23755 [Kofleriaceae bacterium]|jgi:hypothetical protein|nr:hypothetical protein [Kofleriaceae bacterium]